MPSPLDELAELLTPRMTKYIPWEPTETQTAFLLLDHREALYGGAAGGGKSVALLMAALQYVDVPGYNALLLRRTFPQLAMPGGLMDLAAQWLSGTDAHYSGEKKRWHFPSGATVTFGYIDSDADKYQYQGSAFQFVGFDELTQMNESPYRYLFSRVRKPEGFDVPIRVRGATNPGGVGHDWVYQRFFTARKPGRVFIPALLEDNPHLDTADYLESLSELTPVEYDQLRRGSWIKPKSGDWFKPDGWRYVDASELPPMRRRVRYWDTASTKPGARNMDPDFNAGVLLSEFRGRYFIEDIEAFRCGPAETEERFARVAARDGRDVEVWMAQEPGSQSELLVNNYARGIFAGMTFRGDRQTGDKAHRAKPLSAAVHNGLVSLVRGAWNKAFTDEAEAFPTAGIHDDMVDAASGAFSRLHVRNASTRVTAAPVRLQPLKDAAI